jgi:hypothetical protein
LSLIEVCSLVAGSRVPLAFARPKHRAPALGGGPDSPC